MLTGHHLSGLDQFTAADHLPRHLLDPSSGHSYAVDKTAFQEAVGTTKSRWDWFEEHVPYSELGGKGSGYPGYPDDKLKLAHRITASAKGGLPKEDDQLEKGRGASVNGNADKLQDLYTRPELGLFALAMVGGGRVWGQAQAYGKSCISVDLSLESC